MHCKQTYLRGDRETELETSFLYGFMRESRFTLMHNSSPSIRRSRARLAQKKQTASVCIRLFEDERKTLEERAKSASKSLSAFLRDAVLAPIPGQSEDNLAPVQGLIESHKLLNVQEDEQIFGRASRKANGQEQNFSNEVSSGASKRDLASERTGHKPACACFACERLRAILTSKLCENAAKGVKSKRINTR